MQSLDLYIVYWRLTAPVEYPTFTVYAKSFILLTTGTGDNGVGPDTKDYIVEELGPHTVELMRTIKKAIDPDNILNPHKVRLPRKLREVQLKCSSLLQEIFLIERSYL